MEHPKSAPSPPPITEGPDPDTAPRSIAVVAGELEDAILARGRIPALTAELRRLLSRGRRRAEP